MADSTMTSLFAKDSDRLKKIYFRYGRLSGHALLFLALSCIDSSGYCAEGYEDTRHLKSQVDSFVTANVAHDENDVVSVQVSQLDSLKLKQCDKTVTVSFSREGLSNQPAAVILACDGAETWNVYVPIQVQIMTKVLSVTRLVSPGETLIENDIDFVPYDKNRLYDGYFKSKQELVGMTASRAIAAGTPLTRKNVKQVAVIKRNQTITLALRRGAIEIEMIGVAKSDGFMDGPVKVFNPSSKKLVDAVVVGKDRAEITY